MRNIAQTLALGLSLSTGCVHPDSAEYDGGLAHSAPELAELTADQKIACGGWVAAYLDTLSPVFDDHPEQVDMEVMLQNEAHKTCERHVQHTGEMPPLPN